MRARWVLATGSALLLMAAAGSPAFAKAHPQPSPVADLLGQEVSSTVDGHAENGDAWYPRRSERDSEPSGQRPDRRRRRRCRGARAEAGPASARPAAANFSGRHVRSGSSYDPARDRARRTLTRAAPSSLGRRSSRLAGLPCSGASRCGARRVDGRISREEAERAQAHAVPHGGEYRPVLRPRDVVKPHRIPGDDIHIVDGLAVGELRQAVFATALGRVGARSMQFLRVVDGEPELLCRERRAPLRPICRLEQRPCRMAGCDLIAGSVAEARLDVGVDDAPLGECAAEIPASVASAADAPMPRGSVARCRAAARG